MNASGKTHLVSSSANHESLWQDALEALKS
jgi:hypothetical protein